MKRKLSDYVDKVYIINLLSRTDRRHFMIEQFKDIGFYDDLMLRNKLEIVDAVKFPGFNDEVLKTFNEQNNSKIGTTGLYFCGLEHYKVLKRALYYGYKRVLVLEDDACFYKDPEKLFDALDNAPSNFDILHIEGYYYPDESFPTETDWLSILADNIEEARWVEHKQFRLWAAAALMYSKHGMEVITKEQERIFCGSDTPTFFAEDNCYFYNYPLVIQENKDVLSSDISIYVKGASSTNIYERKIDKNKYYKITEF